MNSVVIGSGFGGIAAALRLRAKNIMLFLLRNRVIWVVEQEFLKKMASLLMEDQLLLLRHI